MDADTHPVQADAKKIEDVKCGTHAVTIDLSKGNLMKKVVILEASDDIEVWKAPAKHFDRTLASARSFVGLKNVKELRMSADGLEGQ